MNGEHTIVSGAAGRYATALFELAEEDGKIDAVAGDLKTFAGMLDESDDLKRLVRSPVFGAEDQVKALDALFSKAKIGGLAANVIKLAARNRRLFAIQDIVDAFHKLVAHHRGEVAATVTTAQGLKADQITALKAALKDVTGKDVALEEKIDPSILGGLVVKLGSRMIDTSLKTKLNALRLRMKEVG